MISRGGEAQVQMMDDSVINYSFIPDVKKHTIVAYNNADTINKFYLTYNLTRPGLAELKNFKGVNAADTATYLVIKGAWKKDSVEVWMRRLDPAGFPLLQRGFHWVSDTRYDQ